MNISNKTGDGNQKYLDHRFCRERKEDNIADVYDGLMYQKHFRKNGFLTNRNNISLLGNTDGVAIFKSSTFSVWPIYMVINELPSYLRFKRENRILFGLWFGKSKPNFTTFFKPFTELLWKLFTDGFQITDKDGNNQTCKALLLQMTCDSPAKCMFQDFIQYNGYFGCPYCLNSGFYNKTSHCQTYPYNSSRSDGCGDLRTHKATVEHARIARENMEKGKKKYAEKGVKGLSWAFSLPEFDIINSVCLDYMHAVLLGVMKHLLNFWFSKDKTEIFSINKKIKHVQERLLQIKPPNNITRVPRTLDEMKHWKASEYRSFLLFYGPTCLHGVLEQKYYDHFMLLSCSIWLLLQKEISSSDIDEAARHLQYFCYQMSALYGESAMSFSIHLLLHLPNAVRQNGPLWCQSCFWFEDYNAELRQFFHSSQHPDSQVARAVAIVQKLPEMIDCMHPGSSASDLQRLMTKELYKTKLIKEIEKGISIVGRPEVTNDPNLQHAVELICPFYNGPLTKYKRALINGQMIHSKCYQKVSQRNSYTVEFKDKTNVTQYGQIEYYVHIDSKQDYEEHEKHYYAVMSTLKRKMGH